MFYTKSLGYECSHSFQTLTFANQINHNLEVHKLDRTFL